jgi:hypothetical protein
MAISWGIHASKNRAQESAAGSSPFADHQHHYQQQVDRLDDAEPGERN